MKDRINEIKSAIIEYCRENLNEQYKDISLDVLAKIEQKDGEILNSSRCDIWVASILNIVFFYKFIFRRNLPRFKIMFIFNILYIIYHILYLYVKV